MLHEQKAKAQELHQNHRYAEAVAVYELFWSEHHQECNEWDGWRFAESLRKINRFQDALEVCRTVWRKNSEFDRVKKTAGWCLYQIEIKKDFKEIKEHEKQFLDSAEKILNLTPQDQFSPYTLTVFKVIDYFEEKLEGNPASLAKKVFEWAGKIDPDKLSVECRTIKDQNGNDKKMPSDKEKWYLKQTKALEKLGNHQACLDLCEQACSVLSPVGFTDKNEIWFHRRAALSKIHLGRKDEALAELEHIVRIKKEWFIQREIAQLFYDLGELDQAFKFALEAALNFGHQEHKYKLFWLMGSVLQKQSRIPEAQRHILLALALCINENWGIPPDLQNLAIELGLTLDDIPTLEKLLPDLKKFWLAEKKKLTPRLNGTIKTVFPHGQAGFLRAENNQEYYFKVRDVQHHKGPVIVGMQVSFCIEPSFDPKKGKETEVAVQILLICP